jgi:hypothetical protein
MGDFGMAAFSVFSNLFVSGASRRLEEGHGRSNCQSLFGMSRIPSDNRVRDMLDSANHRFRQSAARPAMMQSREPRAHLATMDLSRRHTKLIAGLSNQRFTLWGEVLKAS